jgi:hypothetical protein
MNLLAEIRTVAFRRHNSAGSFLKGPRTSPFLLPEKPE